MELTEKRKSKFLFQEIEYRILEPKIMFLVTPNPTRSRGLYKAWIFPKLYFEVDNIPCNKTTLKVFSHIISITVATYAFLKYCSDEILKKKEKEI